MREVAAAHTVICFFALSVNLLVKDGVVATTGIPNAIQHRRYDLAAATWAFPRRGSALFQYRMATPSDIAFARRTMVQEKMNPLSISEQTLLVVYDDDEEDDNSKPNNIVGFGQIRPLSDNYSELASVYVLPEARSRGAGSALVTELLRRFDKDDSNKFAKVCLLTLRPTTPFYESFGFQVVDPNKVEPPLPATLRAETFLGNVISAVLGNDLVCMVRNVSP